MTCPRCHPFCDNGFTEPASGGTVLAKTCGGQYVQLRELSADSVAAAARGAA